MSDLTRDSERILSESRAVLRDNREGGRHRRGASESIGRGSAGIKRKHFVRKLVTIALGLLAIWVGAGIAGAILNGIGFWGVMISLLLMVMLFVFVVRAKVETPKRADLARTTDAGKLVARTELWLESQRPALPAPAVKLVEEIGVQLDSLGRQLEHVDPAHPAAAETRKLVGEILPETVESYRRIPDHLRQEERGGATPDRQLVDSLGKISKEIDSVTRQLAEGSLDDLAIKTRYLDYRYGDAEGLPAPDDQGSGVPLPDFDREKTRT